eukprot:GHRQ01007955.1.p2 GENE.GHRQ01007955.1~~GHRQ01007955.1.p2  ORF type:complete len:107 (+),score=18.39 GHRQ01007955.1:784-1104(+)
MPCCANSNTKEVLAAPTAASARASSREHPACAVVLARDAAVTRLVGTEDHSVVRSSAMSCHDRKAPLLLTEAVEAAAAPARLLKDTGDAWVLQGRILAYFLHICYL